ncbi:MAG: DUF3987 domain-containing protein [Planctomycetes bacterium]|nr:DUF3987 domain-containing protein [Planctomycetota bacterium]
MAELTWTTKSVVGARAVLEVSTGGGEPEKFMLPSRDTARPDVLDMLDRAVSMYPDLREHRPAIESAVRGDDEWPEPLSLDDLEELRPVPQPPLHALPSEIRPWLKDAAGRIGCPIEFMIVADVVARSSLAARWVAIQPKRLDDWKVVPNLWGCIVGTPGAMKSPAFTEALRFVQEFEDAAGPENQDAREKHAHRLEVAKQVRAVNSATIKEQLAEGKPPAVVSSDSSLVVAEPEPPAQTRFVTNDPTIESLQCIVNDNRSVLLFRDELVGWIASLGKKGQEHARSAYLEMWSGNQKSSVDRLSRGHQRVEGSVAVLGGIQPDPLRRHLADVARTPAGDDGMLQRFQAVVWPSWKVRKGVDRAPDVGALDRAREAYQHTKAPPAEVVAHGDRPHVVKFDAAAQDRFDQWFDEIHEELARPMPERVESAVSKQRSFVPSLALLNWLADGAPASGVGLSHIENAIELGRFFFRHALRVLHVEDPVARDALRVEDKIREREDRLGKVTKREIARWLNSDNTRASAVVELLVERRLLLPESKPTTSKGGRPTTVFIPNGKWMGAAP